MLVGALYVLVAQMDPGYVLEEFLRNMIDSETNSRVPGVEEDISNHIIERNIELSDCMGKSNHVETEQLKNDEDRPSAQRTDESVNQSVIDINCLNNEDGDNDIGTGQTART
jgi:hypothetical protein